MTSLVFDTHSFVKQLREAGFSEQQAEAQAEALVKAFAQFKEEMRLEELATKRDLAELKADLIRWTVGAGLFQTALIAALLLKLMH